MSNRSRSADNAPGARVKVLDARRPIDLEAVVHALEELAPAGVLEVVAPQEPADLARALVDRGWTVGGSALADGSWSLRVGRGPLPPWLDLADLEPPGPLEKVLDACARLEPGATVLARLPRYPVMLPPHLDRRSLEWQVAMRPDGTALLWVRAP